ncbi:MAG: hypothetical protein M3Z64_00625 [Verrucomicrobiota bacterium]|nr:hypothetical protein [Verrucomicrobiota bacterium]
MAEQCGSTGQIWRRLGRGILVLAAGLALVAIIYRGTPMTFLRAESGQWLLVSHSDAATQQAFRRSFFQTSYGGHYTPLAFLAEFETARLVGTSRSFWKWRQFVAVAALGAALFYALGAVARTFGVTPREGNAVAAALAVMTILHPQMTDLVAWPFMVIQIVWMTLFALALWSLMRLALSPNETRWAWWAAGFAYTSMHVLGLGVVTVAAVVAALLAMIAAAPDRRALAAPCLTLLVAGAIHGWIMFHLLPRGNGTLPAQHLHLIAALKLLLGFVTNFAFAGLRSFTAVTASLPHPSSIAYGWPAGCLITAAALLVLACCFRRAQSEPGPKRTAILTIVVSSIIAFFMMILLIAAREIFEEPELYSLPYFTITPRYLMPLHMIVLGPVCIGAALAARRLPRRAPAACVVLGLAAIATQFAFQATARPFIEPLSQIPHYSAWRQVLATVRQCRTAGLAIPNVPLGALGQEFPADLETFDPLVRADLHLAADERLNVIPWKQYLADRARYRAAPALADLEHTLRLEPK